MPEQKGKRRNRTSRRSQGPSQSLSQVVEARSTAPVRKAQPVKRRGWSPPLWVNVSFGIGMLVIGTVFTIFPQKGMDRKTQIILFFGYLIISGFYLGRAYRQYRARQRT